MKIKTGQSVKVISGKDKGKTGKIIQVFPKLEKVVVDGVNKAFKHLRARGGQEQKGERIEYFSPIHISNVKLVKGEESRKKGSGSVEKKEVKS